MTAESRRAGVSAERVAAVLRPAVNEAMIAAQGSLAEDRCEVLSGSANHPQAYDGNGPCLQCSEHAAEVLHGGLDERAIAHVAAAVAAALDDGLRERVETLAGLWSLTEFPDEPTANLMRLDLAVALAAQPTADGSDQ